MEIRLIFLQTAGYIGAALGSMILFFLIILFFREHLHLLHTQSQDHNRIKQNNDDQRHDQNDHQTTSHISGIAVLLIVCLCTKGCILILQLGNIILLTLVSHIIK